MSIIKYSFRRDDIVTTEPFRKPTYDDLKRVVFFMSKYEEFKEYEIFVSGGLLESETTKDIDIDICGLRTSKNDLKSFMKDVYRYGVEELNILIDLGYYETTEYQVGSKPRWVDVGLWYQNEIEIVEDEIVHFYTYRHKKDDLYKVTVQRPSNKALNKRYYKGYYKVN